MFSIESALLFLKSLVAFALIYESALRRRVCLKKSFVKIFVKSQIYRIFRALIHILQHYEHIINQFLEAKKRRG